MFKNLENIAYIDIIDKHNGNKPNNGGEYGYTCRLWNTGNGVWEVEYRTSAEMQEQYCSVYGVWQHCSDCPEHNESGECRGECSTMTDAEIVALCDKYPSSDVTDWEGMKCGVIDATGHKRRPCKYEGGCIECHPCGHENCL